jgi:hypothetical protein
MVRAFEQCVKLTLVASASGRARLHPHEHWCIRPSTARVSTSCAAGARTFVVRALLALRWCGCECRGQRRTTSKVRVVVWVMPPPVPVIVMG